MPSNNSGIRIGRLCGMFPDRLGWLIGPGGWRKPPPWLGVALDNGAYGAWDKKVPWDEAKWWKLLKEANAACKPLWAVIPDVVTNREATISSWHKWSPIVREHFPELPQAFAVQDGMTPRDVPTGVHTVFVGGSFDWKWDNLWMWTAHFPRVHVARVNTEKRLWVADQAGAVSCDGTGWFMGGDEKLIEMENYLHHSELATPFAPRTLENPATYHLRHSPLARLLNKILKPNDRRTN